jgi:uncharacterized delta-60 repeat protein
MSAIALLKPTKGYLPYRIASQSDGKNIVVGWFTTWNNIPANRVVRLNADGSLDRQFLNNIGSAANSIVHSVAIQSDGKILLGGNFISWNGISVGYLVRLNSNGTLDSTFSSGLNGPVFDIKIQSDGKILAAGEFAISSGVAARRFIRLNSDGSNDTAFITNTGNAANTSARSIGIQSDGKIIISGDFTSWNGNAVGRIARVNSDGTYDSTFTTNVGTASNNTIDRIFIHSDDKILLGGYATTWNGVATTGNIRRLNSNGTLDTAFNTNIGTNANSSVAEFKTQSDGKIILVGGFTSWNGATVGLIVRLNTDGTRDTTFTTNTGTGADSNGIIDGFTINSDNTIILCGRFSTWNGILITSILKLSSNGIIDQNYPLDYRETIPYVKVGGSWKVSKSVYNKINGAWKSSFLQGGLVDSINFSTTPPNDNSSCIAIQSDGKIIVGGSFTTWNGVTVNGIVRLNPDGTIDTDFKNNTGTAADQQVLELAIQSDGKIIVGGQFDIWNGVTVKTIVRLNPDGTRDTSFTTNTGTGATDPVGAIAIQPDGKIIVGSYSTTWNGTTVNYIVRLNPDGTRDTSFTTNTGTAGNMPVQCILLQTDGKIILGGSFTTWNGVTVNRIVRLNSDGTRDTAFTTNTGTGASSSTVHMSLQSDGKIIIGGAFVTWNGVTVNRIVRLNPDGTRDTTFTSNTGTAAASGIFVVCTAVQADGKILLGGAFTTWDGTTVNNIVRLNSDGTRDTAFTTNTGTAAGADYVTVLSVQNDNKILLGGNFTTWNGFNRSRLVRLGGDFAG